MSELVQLKMNFVKKSILFAVALSVLGGENGSSYSHSWNLVSDCFFKW